MSMLQFCRIANQVWQSLPQQAQVALRQNIHLRPISKSVTVVSTFSHSPMRGAQNLGSVEAVTDKLLQINEAMDVLNGSDFDAAQQQMLTLGFKKRNSKSSLEEQVQADLINKIDNDAELPSILSAAGSIKFIASEFITEKGKNKIDVIGFDGKDLFFFEIKRGRTTKIEQLKSYIEFYGSSNKRPILENILKNYPLSPVNSFRNIRGVMVMQFAENSNRNWQQLADQSGVDILFYDGELKWVKYCRYNIG